MNDDELLDALTRSLRAPEAEPSPAEVAALHDALAGNGRAGSVLPLRPRAVLGRPVLASAAAVLLIAAGGWAVAANHRTRPAPVKVLATSEAHLRDALANGDRPAIAAAADDVRSNLAKLDDDDRRKVEPAATQLLAEADEPGEANNSGPTGEVSGGPGPGPGADEAAHTGITSPRPTAAPRGSPTPTTEAGDDHGPATTEEPTTERPDDHPDRSSTTIHDGDGGGHPGPGGSSGPG